MARPSRTALYANDPTFLWKAILRAFSILIALIGIATFAWAYDKFVHDLNFDGTYSTYNSYDDNFDEAGTDFLYLPWSFITLGLSILWNVINLAVLLSRNKPIRPGANVACDLLLWLFLITTGIFATFGATNFLYFYYYQDERSAPQHKEYENALHHKGTVIAVGATMSFVVLYVSQTPDLEQPKFANPSQHRLFHFALFVSACRYEHARRHSAGSKRAQAITAEATKIAQQMVANMTGPNGSFRPRTPQQEHSRGPEDESSKYDGIQQPANATSQQPSRQISGRSSILDLPPPGQPSSSFANREPPEIKVERASATHPALRFERDVKHDV